MCVFSDQETTSTALPNQQKVRTRYTLFYTRFASSYCTFENRKVIRAQSMKGKHSQGRPMSFDRRPQSVFLMHKDSNVINGRLFDEEEDEESIVKGL